ncbi:MAG: hypothetical protein JNL96_28750 [Planctomycetaceae bacterium]|nr:hypothetical protein [Planctomycetaceae bacterium]
MSLPAPVCPNCESDHLVLVSSREGSDFFDPDTGELIRRTICIYQCACGREFAQAFQSTTTDFFDVAVPPRVSS